MIEELNQGLLAYRAKWDELISTRSNQEFFNNLKLTGVCWKADDLEDFDRRMAELRDGAELVNMAVVNERWLGTVCLREPLAWGDIRIAKVYQKRPGSSDPSGLDHVDFYAPQIDENVLAAEPNLNWTHESNHELCKWISLWFDDTEAKLRTNTTLDVCAAELVAASKEIRNG